jgi:hypothetical protein
MLAISGLAVDRPDMLGRHRKAPLVTGIGRVVEQRFPVQQSAPQIPDVLAHIRTRGQRSHSGLGVGTANAFRNQTRKSVVGDPTRGQLDQKCEQRTEIIAITQQLSKTNPRAGMVSIGLREKQMHRHQNERRAHQFCIYIA